MNEYDETELMYWAEVAECFVETHDCAQSCLENSEEMKGIYERIVRAYHYAKPPSIEDVEKLFSFFADCPRIKKSYDKNGKLMLTTCIDEIIELQEKIYVWDSATNKYIETWQKADYKGDEIKL